VRFYGIDVLSFQGVGREKVLAYLQKYAPEKVDSTDLLFRVLATEENNWPTRLNQSILQQAFIPLHQLISYFTTNKDSLSSISSSEEWEQTFKYLEVMEQGLFVNVKDVPASLSSKKLGRDDYMYQNMLYLMKKERQNTKFMFWAHNDHIANNEAEKKVGYHLRQRFGNKYYALGLECNQGTFQARVLLPDGYWGDLKEDTILPVQKSVDWYLARTEKGNLFIDLRSTSSNLVVNTWLESPIRYGRGNWGYRGSNENFEIRKLKDFYDGILFIERSTPVRPTKNALARSKNRIGF
jgi:erythromycin esterase